MNYYKTGEFAKKASISIRTVRYYDQKGLLKPSVIDTNGYRLYTDKDFEKLQKILSLKYCWKKRIKWYQEMHLWMNCGIRMNLFQIILLQY